MSDTDRQKSILELASFQEGFLEALREQQEEQQTLQKDIIALSAQTAALESQLEQMIQSIQEAKEQREQLQKELRERQNSKAEGEQHMRKLNDYLLVIRQEFSSAAEAQYFTLDQEAFCKQLSIESDELNAALSKRTEEGQISIKGQHFDCLQDQQGSWYFSPIPITNDPA